MGNITKYEVIKANENGRKTKLIKRPKCGKNAISVLICAIALCFKLIRDPFNGCSLSWMRSVNCFKIELSIMFIEMGKEWVASPLYQAIYFLPAFSPPMI